jgi:hypothetical protein
MKEEEIIKKYRIGPQSRVRFKNDPKFYFVKNIHPDRKHLFITKDSQRKRIIDLVEVDNKMVFLNENIKKKIKNFIPEILIKLKKEKCSCGCDGKCPKSNISENLKFHLENKKLITENTFRYGSSNFLNLWSEARKLYESNLYEFDKKDSWFIKNTDLGKYGIYEGKLVPLDLPLEEGSSNPLDIIKMDVPLFIRMLEFAREDAKNDVELHKVTEQILLLLKTKPSLSIDDYKDIIDLSPSMNENKSPQLNKPKRGGPKKYYVYTRNPKTKKIIKVNFGDSGGLKAKINNPKARQAFAKRHKCGTGEPKTSARYWSCRLPRFSKLLGLKSSYSGFW